MIRTVIECDECGDRHSEIGCVPLRKLHDLSRYREVSNGVSLCPRCITRQVAEQRQGEDERK